MIKATWSDGAVVTGRYVGTERGYILLKDIESDEVIACNATQVEFEAFKAATGSA